CANCYARYRQHEGTDTGATKLDKISSFHLLASCLSFYNFS
ncbi:MAG: hypothetical protein ACI95X_002348, partial [Paraglaciecola sp.]